MDTDFENYIVTYACHESADYKDKKSWKKLEYKDVWKQRKSVNKVKREDSDLFKIQIDHGDEIIIKPKYIEQFQILWKPGSKQNYSEKVKSLVKSINFEQKLKQKSTKNIEAPLDINSDFDHATHDADCDYNPYEKIYQKRI